MLRLDGRGPLYLQTYHAIRGAILDGRLPAGSRLPSSRELAAELGLSRTVTLTAFAQLKAEGYVVARRGSGTRVAGSLPEHKLVVEGGGGANLERRDDVRISRYGSRVVAVAPFAASATSDLRIDFRYGYAPPEGASRSVWKRLIHQAAAKEHLDYQPPEGHTGSRAALVRHLHLHRGVRCEADQIVLVSGSQQALALCAQLLLDPGDHVLIEEPHYQGARAVLLAAGARLVASAVDEDGLDVTRRAPGADRARLVYVTPSHQFPTGAVMPLERRLALLEWASERDAYILEDDYDGEYRYEGRPIEAVQGLDGGGRTIYIGTLSKVLYPALRLGFVVLPPALVPVFRAGKWIADRHSPTLEQIAFAEFLESGEYERHLRRMRRRHAARRDALIAALGRFLGSRGEVMGTDAGIHLVLWLDELASADLPELIARAAERGVGLYSIARYYMAPPDRAGLLMGYGALEESQIEEGIAILSELLTS